MVDTIEETIVSVLDQNYSDLEYIIIDGGSTDGTVDIIKKYTSRLTYWKSEPDGGMYHALNKGFAKSTGDIMLWINADDLLVPNAFYYINKLFEDCPSVDWIQGFNSFVDSNGVPIPAKHGKSFSRLKYYRYDYQWIQQESTAWRRNLWQKSGAKLREKLKYAGDMELWCRFFQHAELHNVPFPIGAFRKRREQLSAKFRDDYIKEAETVKNQMKLSEPDNIKNRKIKALKLIDKIFGRVRIINRLLTWVINKLLDGKKINYSSVEMKFQVAKK